MAQEQGELLQIPGTARAPWSSAEISGMTAYKAYKNPSLNLHN